MQDATVWVTRYDPFNCHFDCSNECCPHWGSAPHTLSVKSCREREAAIGPAMDTGGTGVHGPGNQEPMSVANQCNKAEGEMRMYMYTCTSDQ